MNQTSLKLIEQIIRGADSKRDLIKSVQIKTWQLNAHLNKLEKLGYIITHKDVIKLSGTAKSILLRDVSKKFDIMNMLKDSTEIIFSNLVEPKTISDLEQLTGLSNATIHRATSNLRSIGILQKERDTYNIILDDKLKLFAATLKTENTSTSESTVEMIFQNDSTILKKIIKNKYTDGQTTGFTLFNNYEIKYDDIFDYYIKQDKPLDLEDILIHSVVIARYHADKSRMIMCVIFYLKNKEKLDLVKLRKIAITFKVLDIWIDIEGYIRNGELKNKHLFLPKHEFVTKADLYDIAKEEYTLPEAFPNLFKDVGNNLSKNVVVYLLGGENMRLKGLKPTTKDCDLVVTNESDYHTIQKVLIKMKYREIKNDSFTKEDMRINPMCIFIHATRSRFDIFIQQIANLLYLTDTMKQRAVFEEFEHLQLGILSNEDVFILKAVTDREGDLQDMFALIQNKGNMTYHKQNFDWGIVWNELLKQVQMNPISKLASSIFDSIEALNQQFQINTQFRDKLCRYVVDRDIIRLLMDGSLYIKEIIIYLKTEGQISEQFIRNRIDSLVNSKIIKKILINKKTKIQLAKRIFLPKCNLDINKKNLIWYLRWRFPLRGAGSDISYDKFAHELVRLEFNNINQVDVAAVKYTQTLHKFESQNKGKKLNDLDALQMCVKLYNESV